MKLTPAQEQSIQARGNVLVSASAGTGKTRTLVERCVRWLLDPQQNGTLEEVLMVTFTEAAATEMRQRIRQRLQEEWRAQSDSALGERIQQQLALLDTAAIGTLHSFCFRLVRLHFHELGLDPGLMVIPQEQCRLLAREVLEHLLEQHYGRDDEIGRAVQQLIQESGRGWDQPIRELIWRIHEHTQTLVDPEGWVRRHLALFREPEPKVWEEWLLKALHTWRDHWLPVLDHLAGVNGNARLCREALRSIPASATRPQIAQALDKILESDRHWPPRQKTILRQPLQSLFSEAEFFFSLTELGSAGAGSDAGRVCDPLLQDWNWVRWHMLCLLELAIEFGHRFAQAKRDLGALDFHDLEQQTLRLLWDRQTNSPSPAALEWRSKFQQVFVDEYQDINWAQDCILRALSRDGPERNRFLVGDAKQSIYRFRLAVPKIFKEYQALWQRDRPEGQVIWLTDNFRSHPSILDFVNGLFESLERRGVGQMEYDSRARLFFGDPTSRGDWFGGPAAPRVEVHLRSHEQDLHGRQEEEATEKAAEFGLLSAAEREARMVALRLRQMKEDGYKIWKEKRWEPVAWGDMVVLLRSPRLKADIYAKEFARLGVPLTAARLGFYESSEVADWLCLLQILDNPLQDIPLLAVLRSPILGLTLEELVSVRAANRHGYFWTALQRFHQVGKGERVWSKVDQFLKRFAQWRCWARRLPLSDCLVNLLDETVYLSWLRLQDRAAQRAANLERLLCLTRQFDRFQRQGLFRFLKFVESQHESEAELEVGSDFTENAVRLFSIHQSKGLEFPVVVVADLAKPFNLADLKAQLILDEELGLCPLIKPPHTGQRYPSLPHWLARRAQKKELLSEELRLLYVALTRAQDTLILTGIVSASARRRWAEKFSRPWPPDHWLSARSLLDWLGPCWTDLIGRTNWIEQKQGSSELFSWRIWEEDPPPAKESPALKPLSREPDAGQWQALYERMRWQYPFVRATTHPAKASVSLLRRRLSRPFDEESFRPRLLREGEQVQSQPGGELNAIDKGIAHHLFLQFLDISRIAEPQFFTHEADRLHRSGALSAEQRQTLDLDAIRSFWDSELGRQIRLHPRQVQRELAFTARLTTSQLAGLGLDSSCAGLSGEFVVVQGVVDLALILAGEIWILDFKTDQVKADELEQKTRVYLPQLNLYSLALSQIYRRPVSQQWIYFLAVQRAIRLPGLGTSQVRLGAQPESIWGQLCP